MNHVNTLMTVMCNISPTCGKYGARAAPTGVFFGNTESLHPDDVHFAAQWHGTSGGAIDMGASAWFFNGATFTRLNSGLTLTFCPGQMVPVSFSHAIKGKNNIPLSNPMPGRIVFSSNTTISALDTTGGTVVLAGNRGQFFSNQVPVMVPSLAPGTYELGLVIDPANAFVETDEGNNTTLLNLRVRVPSGC
jgi:hypothetical protein